MSFGANEVGLERGATKLLFDVEPVILDRNAEPGTTTPARVEFVGLDGTAHVVEMAQVQSKRHLRLETIILTEAQKTTLYTLMAAGAITVKTVKGAATTYTCLWAPGAKQLIEDAVGPRPDSATDAQWYRLELEFVLVG